MRMRRGRGSLQVMIAGSGSRPSILTMGGLISPGSGTEGFRNRLPFMGTGIGGANWCCLRA